VALRRAANLSGCDAPAGKEVENEKYDARDERNVNESSRDVKCKKTKQPKHDQNSGDHSQHVFIS
jgi:hypothetical protein